MAIKAYRVTLTGYFIMDTDDCDDPHNLELHEVVSQMECTGLSVEFSEQSDKPENPEPSNCYAVLT